MQNHQEIGFLFLSLCGYQFLREITAVAVRDGSAAPECFTARRTGRRGVEAAPEPRAAHWAPPRCRDSQSLASATPAVKTPLRFCTASRLPWRASSSATTPRLGRSRSGGRSAAAPASCRGVLVVAAAAAWCVLRYGPEYHCGRRRLSSRKNYAAAVHASSTRPPPG